MSRHEALLMAVRTHLNLRVPQIRINILLIIFEMVPMVYYILNDLAQWLTKFWYTQAPSTPEIQGP